MERREEKIAPAPHKDKRREEIVVSPKWKKDFFWGGEGERTKGDFPGSAVCVCVGCIFPRSSPLFSGPFLEAVSPRKTRTGLVGLLLLTGCA